MQNKCIWLYGLPCSGKSTLAKKLLDFNKHSILLDGDDIRSKLYDNQIGFSKKDRHKHLIRIAKLVKLLIDQNKDVICSFVTPFEETRKEIRDILNSSLLEVFLDTPLEECVKRDVKGMYKLAKRGEIKDFSGISGNFEKSKNAHLVLDTSKLTINDCFNKIVEKWSGHDLTRKVGTEASREYVKKCLNGFYDKYMTGSGLDIGYSGYTEGCQPILKNTIGIDLNYPGYDGKQLPFEDESQDYIFSSHMLEHVKDYTQAIEEWYRVLKYDGYMVITVPHQYAYEKKLELPSKWNGDHKRFYTCSSLLGEIEDSLTPNSYRIIHVKDNVNTDLFMFPPKVHSNGPYEIELVLKKIKTPDWKLK
jgi:adenylyl-sulfate kinase